MSQSQLYLVRVWSVHEGLRADVREVSSEDTRVFWSHDELARFFLERIAILAGDVIPAAASRPVIPKEPS